ncbi:MAG: OmpA family protein, partial [candidate division WOR-3 bacterium]
QKLSLYIAFRPNYDTLTRELYKLSSENNNIKCFEPYKIKDEIDFDIGSAQIKDEYKPILEKIYYDIDWKNIKELIIEGYADSLPIKGELAKKYPSNWELSSARALSVAKYLINLGAPSHKLRLSYTGEFRKSQRKVEFYIVR